MVRAADFNKSNYYRATDRYYSKTPSFSNMIPTRVELRNANDEITSSDLSYSRVLRAVTLVASFALLGYAVYRNPKAVFEKPPVDFTTAAFFLSALLPCQNEFIKAWDVNRPQASTAKKVKDYFEVRAAFRSPANELMMTIAGQIAPLGIMHLVGRIFKDYPASMQLASYAQAEIVALVATTLICPIISLAARRFATPPPVKPPVQVEDKLNADKLNALDQVVKAPILERTDSLANLHIDTGTVENPDDVVPIWEELNDKALELLKEKLTEVMDPKPEWEPDPKPVLPPQEKADLRDRAIEAIRAKPPIAIPAASGADDASLIGQVDQHRYKGSASRTI